MDKLGLKILSRSSNQALGLASYAKEFMKAKKSLAPEVLERVKLFHTDSFCCGISALSLKTNAPTILRQEALEYKHTSSGYRSKVIGDPTWVRAEKAICANSSAAREWDSNGTVFGYNEKLPTHRAGEFGHNDFYAVPLAAAHNNSSLNGSDVLRGMLLTDEIRGRLAEVFSLKSYKIDHVVHGAIASAATYGAMLGATEEQIESAIGMVVAHYIPWRAIRAGKQLSDSKGASAAISTEAAIMSVHRAMRGFLGPRDIFRNPESIFRYFEKTNGDSPFDIAVGEEGSDFSVMGMHFKLGLYEHQSAGVLQGVIDLVHKYPELTADGISNIDAIEIAAYEPAFGIIGDPAKRDPKTRQSADHSMVFIVSRLLKKAIDLKDYLEHQKSDGLWKKLILLPEDYSKDALHCSETRKLMNKIKFRHEKEFDALYPEGIPSQIDITVKNGKKLSSGLVMFPSGHAKNTTCDLRGILENKNRKMLEYSLDSKAANEKLDQLNNIDKLTNRELESLYDCQIKYAEKSIDI